jgi:hypothetical protein
LDYRVAVKMTAQHFGYTVGGATTEGKQPELIKRERVKNDPSTLSFVPRNVSNCER